MQDLGAEKREFRGFVKRQFRDDLRVRNEAGVRRLQNVSAINRIAVKTSSPRASIMNPLHVNNGQRLVLLDLVQAYEQTNSMSLLVSHPGKAD